jgi:hypothetical protein
MAKSTASMPPASAFETSARWSASPSTTVTRSRSSAGSFEGVRARTVTSCPATRACSRHSLPSEPVAPKMLIFMARERIANGWLF